MKMDFVSSQVVSLSSADILFICGWKILNPRGFGGKTRLRGGETERRGRGTI